MGIPPEKSTHLFFRLFPGDNVKNHAFKPVFLDRHVKPVQAQEDQSRDGPNPFVAIQKGMIHDQVE